MTDEMEFQDSWENITKKEGLITQNMIQHFSVIQH